MMTDIKTGKPFTRRDFGKGLAAILAAGVAPSLAFGAVAGLRRGVAARAVTMALPYDAEVEYLYSNGDANAAWISMPITTPVAPITIDFDFKCISRPHNYCRFFTFSGSGLLFFRSNREKGFEVSSSAAGYISSGFSFNNNVRYKAHADISSTSFTYRLVGVNEITKSTNGFGIYNHINFWQATPT